MPAGNPPTPAGVPAGQQLTALQIAALIRDAWGGDATTEILVTGVAVCLGESGGWTAINGVFTDTAGNYARGLWQFMTFHATITDVDAYDPVRATQLAHQFWLAARDVGGTPQPDGAPGWDPWEAYTGPAGPGSSAGNYRVHLEDARQAVAALGPGGSPPVQGSTYDTAGPLAGGTTVALDAILGRRLRPASTTLLVEGGRLAADVADAVIAATLDATIDQVTQLTLEVKDPDLRVLDAGVFSPGAHAVYGDVDLEVAAVDVGPGGGGATLTVELRDAGAQRMKRAVGVFMLADVSPSEFMGQEAMAAGLLFVAEDTPRRPTIARTRPVNPGDVAESAWEVGQRLAGELGFVAFAAAGVYYFARPSWLAARVHRIPLEWKGADTGPELLSIPACRRTGDDADRPVAITFPVDPRVADYALPGMAVDFHGVPTFDGVYLIAGVTLEATGSPKPAALYCVSAVDPTPKPSDTKPEEKQVNYGDPPPPTQPGNADVVDVGGARFSRTPEVGVHAGNGWYWPASGVITGHYGDPRPWRGGIHEGTDIADPAGSPGVWVVAARSGVITFLGEQGGYGNCIQVDHGGGVSSFYAHLAEFAAGLEASPVGPTEAAAGGGSGPLAVYDPGSPSFAGKGAVEHGRRLGYMGYTGHVEPPGPDGQHLHFEVLHDGAAVDAEAEFGLA